MSEKRQNIQSLRESSNQVDQAQQELSNLVVLLQRSVQRLHEDWHNPAVADISAITASLTQQLGNVGATLQRTSAQMHQVANQSEQESQEREDSEQQTTDKDTDV